MAFDPYHKWLGIPPEEQPPNHYRLLAIPQFESDADVIETAAEQRTLLLRTFQIGPESALAERLLNEVSAARVCLLRPATKAEYDDSLRDVGIEVVPTEPPGLDRHDPTKTRPESYLVPIVAGGLLLIPLIGVLWWFIGRDGSDDAVQNNTPPAQQTPDISAAEEFADKAAEDKAATKEAVLRVITRRQHQDWVRSVAYSPDGKRIASGSSDRTLKIWVAETFRHPYLTLKGHKGVVRSVAFSPDSGQIISGSFDKTVRVWDAQTGKTIRTLKGHKSHVHSVAFSPDGKRIVSGSEDKTLKVWNAETGQELLTLNGHTSGVYGVAFSPDSKRIVSGSYDNTVKVWNAGNGQEERTIKGHSDNVTSVAISPNGKQIISGSYDDTVKVWDAETGHLIRTLKGHKKDVRSVAISPDGRWIASGSHDTTVKMWDAETGQLMRTLKQSRMVYGVAISPDGKRIVSGSLDRSVKLWILPPLVFEAPAEAAPKKTAAKKAVDKAAEEKIAANLKNGLVAYYPFNGNAKDESGNGNHGEMHGAILESDRHGNTNQAYLFDGVDDYIKCPSIFEKYYPLSMSAWIKVKGPFPDTRFLYSVLSKPHSSRQSGFKLALMKDRVYSTTHPDGASVVRVEAYINGILDEWHCVSLTNNGEHNSLFLNGVKVDQRPAQSLKSFSGVLQQNVLIGREFQSYEVNRRSFNGSIDDIRIYNRALSEAEVKALYDFEKP